jgi:nitrate reductase NapE
MAADTRVTQERPSSRFEDLLAFVLVAIVIWPIIAVIFVGAYGLAFWIYFMLAGPPGPS